MRTSLAVPVTLVVLLAAACGASNDSTDSPDEPANYATDGTFTYAINVDSGAFKPFGAFAYLAYDPLVNLRPDGEFASGLAEEWAADANGATFTLREGITCSDGTPLTASDVADNITYVADPANGSPSYGTMVPTVPLTVDADDAARTVTVTFEKPFGFPLHTIGNLPIVCQKGLSDPELFETSSDGTGPFVLTDVVPGQRYTLTRRDDYTWGPDGATTSEPGTPKEVVLRIVTSQTTAANLLLSGEVNFAPIGGSDVQRLERQGLERIELPSPGPSLWFNQIDNRPTEDVRVRRALVQALDLDEVIKISTGGEGGPATGLVTLEPQACPGDTVSGQLPEYSLAAAEALLDEAGWLVGPDGTRSKDGESLSLDLHYLPPVSVHNRPTAEFIAQQWESIGVHVTLSADDVRSLSHVLFETSDYDVSMRNIAASLPSQLIPYLTGPVPPSGTNLAGINNAEYEELIAQAQELAPPAACTYWDRAEQALWQNLDILLISNLPSYYYLANAEAEIAGLSYPIPTSIRVLD